MAQETPLLNELPIRTCTESLTPEHPQMELTIAVRRATALSRHLVDFPKAQCVGASAKERDSIPCQPTTAEWCWDQDCLLHGARAYRECMTMTTR